MSGIQRLGAIVAASLLLPIPGGAKPEVIGVVMEATHARLGAYAVSEGSSVFDGDKLLTETGGDLRLRSGKAMFYLKDESSVIVRSKAGGEEKVLQAELFAGELIISSARGAEVEILARNAHVRPGEDKTAILQVRVLSPKTLSIFARRGTAEFSYRNDDAVIAEGKSYRVELDPPDDGSAADEKNKKAARKKKKFIMIAIGAAAGGAAAAGTLATGTGSGTGKMFESPDRP